MVAYQNLDRIKREEDELQALEDQYRKENDPEYKAKKEAEAAANKEPPAVGAEEETWKKRHGDLRRYSQQQLNEKEKALADKEREISELKKTLERSGQTGNMPRSKDEAEEWVKKYPDLARVIMTLIEEKTDIVREDVRSAKSELAETNLQIARQQAFSQLLAAHPDFLDIRNDPKFKEWAESQPEQRGKIGQTIYDALYKNNTDADLAIKAVDIYKSDTRHSGKTTPEKDAARSIRSTSVEPPPTNNGKRTFKESEINTMSMKDYDRLEKEIDEAKREGRLVYDITGAAR